MKVQHNEWQFHTPFWPDGGLNKMANRLQKIYSKYTFVNNSYCVMDLISLKFVPKAPIQNKFAFVWVMTWYMHLKG